MPEESSKPEVSVRNALAILFAMVSFYLLLAILELYEGAKKGYKWGKEAAP